MLEYNGLKVPKFMKHRPLNKFERQSSYCELSNTNCTGVKCKECIFHIQNLESFIEWEKSNEKVI